jgi:RNA polymerase sigma factor (sigma-70 family)
LNATGPARPSTQATSSPDALAKQFEHRVGFFANKVARDFMLGQRWRDELESAGYWGLAKALANRRRDACYGELSAYVSQRIEGAVLDEARRCLRLTRLVDVSGSESGSCNGDGNLDDGAWPFARRVADPGRTPEEIAAERRLRECVEDLLERMEPEDRALLRAYMGGSSLMEIARRKHVPAGTVRVRFDRLARRLRGRGSPLRRLGFDAGS